MIAQPTPFRIRPLPFGDLVLYVCVFFAYVGATFFAGKALFQVDPTLRLILVTLLNLVVIGGGALLVNHLRGTFELRHSGFWPIRINWMWVAAGLAGLVLLLPLRMVLGYAATQLLEGGMESLNRRSQLMLGNMQFTWHGALLSLLGVGILAPIGEELLFRGGIFGWFRARFGMWASALASGVLFGLGHFDSVAVAATSFVMGIALAWVYERSRTLWTPILMHIINNSGAMAMLQVMLFVNTYFPHLAPQPAV